MKRRILISTVLSVLLLAALAANVHAAEVKINASDGAAHDCFGRSVAISGDYAIVGACLDDDNGGSSGSAYIFKRDGTAWTEQAKIYASDGAAGDYFGESVAISGDYVVVGAWGDDDAGCHSGSAYIFKRDGTEWIEQTKITASDGAEGDLFGYSVAISGDCAVVGAYRDDNAGWDSGSAHIFKRNGTEWIEEVKITASDGAEGDNFGISVAISGDYAVVGAYEDDDAGYHSGSAYIYDLPIGIFSCDSDGDPRDQFAPGETVYVTGTNLITSASYKLWIQNESVGVGDALATGEDPSPDGPESVVTDASGTLPVTAIWVIDVGAAVTNAEYDLVADNQAAGAVGTYNPSSDLLDSASTAGFVAPVQGLYVFTTADAGIALQIAVGSRPSDLRWDVSGDKRVTSLDALMIMQAVSGAIEL